MPFISIVIPTRNRADQVGKTIDVFMEIINCSRHQENIELICVDNFSTDHTWQVLEKAAEIYGRSLIVKKQLRQCHTAESSAFLAAEYATGDYIWLFGDDDIPHQDSIDSLFEILFSYGPAFLLLNINIQLGDAQISYINSLNSSILFNSGRELFKSFGLVSATTTLSCIVFQRERFNNDLFWRLNSISQIYSHTCALLGSFHDSPCVFLPRPLLTYRQNSLDEESQRIGTFSLTSDTSFFYPYTAGLSKLLVVVEKYTLIPVAEILEFEEIELSKTTWRVKHSLLWCFIVRMTLNSLSLISSEKNSDAKRLIEEITQVIRILRMSTSSEAAYIATQIEYLLGTSLYNFRRLLPKIIKYIDNLENNFFLSRLPRTCRGGLYFQEGVMPKSLCASNTASANEVLLSILVPSYSRPMAISRLLSHFSSAGIFKLTDVEVVVAVNSDPGSFNSYKTEESLWSSAATNLRFEFHTVFAATAEENINRSIAFCRGKYVQILGDDDILIPCTFAFLLSMLRHPRELEGDIFIFNSNETDGSVHKFLDMSSFSGWHDFPFLTNQISYASFVACFGITTASAFISRYVFKASLFCGYDDFLSLSPVYSHVFGFLRSFNDESCIISDFPLVLRGDSDVGERFSALASSSGRTNLFYWTDGFLLLVEYAVNAQIFKPDFLFTIKENPRPGFTFYLWFEIMLQYSRQLILLTEGPLPVRRAPEHHNNLLKFISNLKSAPNVLDQNSLEYLSVDMLNLYGQLGLRFGNAGELEAQARALYLSILDLYGGNSYFLRYQGRWEKSLLKASNLFGGLPIKFYRHKVPLRVKNLYRKLKLFIRSTLQSRKLLDRDI